MGEYPQEFIVQMGFYPDRFAQHELPPDVFFMSVTFDAPLMYEHELLFVLQDVVEALVWAACDKYHLLNEERGFDLGYYSFDWQDTFWSISPKADA